MSRRVFVTGIGIVCGIGKNFAEVFESLKNSRTGIRHPEILNTVHREIPAAEVKLSNSQLKELCGLPDISGWSRTALLGMVASGEALRVSGDSGPQCRTGIVSGTTVGGMDKSEAHYNDFLNNDNSNIYISTHDCGDSTEKIAGLYGIKDYMTTISTACSSSANAIIHAANLIRNGVVDKVVAGGTDGLAKFTINGFISLMILDKELCRPFDKNRNGLNLGEGAGYIVLESEDLVNKSNKKPLCELKGYGNANEAFHQTASSPDGEGAYTAMKNALNSAGLNPGDITYINAHGTATPNNDLSEGIAIGRLFGEQVPHVSSTKAYTGHTLGAAGGIEAVFSVLSIINNAVFPNLHYSEKIEELAFEPVKEFLSVPVMNVMSNSFGFGGNNSSLIFSKV